MRGFSTKNLFRRSSCRQTQRYSLLVGRRLSNDTPQVLENLVKARTHELEEAVRSNKQFITTVSHEIRTPLSGVMGALTLLGESALADDQSQLLRIARLGSEQLMVCKAANGRGARNLNAFSDPRQRRA